MIEIPVNLLINNSETIKGLIDGSLVRLGGTIRVARGLPGAGQIVKLLGEAPGLTQSLLAANPISAIGSAVNTAQLWRLDTKVSQALGISQIAAGASVLNLGVSILGFAYVGYKLNQLQSAVSELRTAVDAGFERIEGGLRQVQQQIGYITILAEQSLVNQKAMKDSIDEIHRFLLAREVAELAAWLPDLDSCSADEARDCRRTASRVRTLLRTASSQFSIINDLSTLPSLDVAIRGWAVASRVEGRMLLQMERRDEAVRLLEEESAALRSCIRLNSRPLLADNSSELSTAYKLCVREFRQEVLPERVDRIARVSAFDDGLSDEEVSDRRGEAQLEIEGSKYSGSKAAWLKATAAKGECLDGWAELSDRLDTLMAAAEHCRRLGIDLRELAPPKDAPAGLTLIDYAGQEV